LNNDMKVVSIERASPLFGRVRPGYRLVSVNGRKVLDVIDFHYRVTDERVRLTFADPRGRQTDFEFVEPTAAHLGLTFDDHRIRHCNCDCIFCFVSQQPKGMRPALYVRDEDYRLSFTHGNYVTLSNVSESDLARIIEQRLSPLYVSVHATDDALRRSMLRNDRLSPILPRLCRLTDNGITIHSQVVLCPSINDGRYFEQTVDDLAALHPGVASLAVVPVGLTRYREGLPPLRTYTAQEAGEIIDYIETRQAGFHARTGSRFVWPADEFYVAAGRAFPPRHVYEDMPQFENGVGMAREFMTGFNRRRSRLKGIRSDSRVMMLTGCSAYPFLSEEILPYVTETLGLNLSLHRVFNRFWGETVTVTGLLTGQDLLQDATDTADQYDLVALPPNCLNADQLFLDDLSLAEFRERLGKPVLVGRYNLAQTIREAFS